MTWPFGFYTHTHRYIYWFWNVCKNNTWRTKTIARPVSCLQNNIRRTNKRVYITQHIYISHRVIYVCTHTHPFFTHITVLYTLFDERGCAYLFNVFIQYAYVYVIENREATPKVFKDVFPSSPSHGSYRCAIIILYNISREYIAYYTIYTSCGASAAETH